MLMKRQNKWRWWKSFKFKFRGSRTFTFCRGLPKPPKPGTYQEPGSVKISKTRNRNLPGSPKTWQTSNRNLTRNRNQEFKALHLGLPRKFLVEPGILGKNQEESQEVLGKVEWSKVNHCWTWIIGHDGICCEDIAACFILYFLLWTISWDN